MSRFRLNQDRTIDEQDADDATTWWEVGEVVQEYGQIQLGLTPTTPATEVELDALRETVARHFDAPIETVVVP